MRAISFGSDVLASAGCRRMRDFCGERLPAAVQPFSRQSFDKTQSPVGTRFDSTTGDLLSVHRATIFLHGGSLANLRNDLLHNGSLAFIRHHRDEKYDLEDPFFAEWIRRALEKTGRRGRRFGERREF